VRRRRHVDDPHPLPLLQLGQQHHGEEVVAEVVDAKLVLKALLGGHVGAGHDAGVVEQDVDLLARV